MTSQIPFTPLTAEALARLTPDERNTFALAAEQVAAEQKPSMMTIVALVEMVGRLIAESVPTAGAALPAVRDYRVVVDYEDEGAILIGPCAHTIGCLFYRKFSTEGAAMLNEGGVTLGALIDAATEHQGEQGERAHARVAEIEAETDAAAREHNANG